MQKFKSFIFYILSIKIISKPIIKIIKKLIIKSRYSNNFFSHLTNPELQELIQRLTMDNRLQNLKLDDKFIKQVSRNEDLLNKILNNVDFNDHITQKESLIKLFTNSSKYLVLEKQNIDIQQGNQIDKTLSIKDKPKVSILICTPDINSVFTKRCIESVKKYTKNYKYELILLENGKLHDFNHAREINRALSTSLGDYFITLDEDVELTPNWLDSLIRHSGPDVGVVGCMNLNSNPKNKEKIRYTGTWVDTSGNVHSFAKEIDEPINSPFVCSSCILINNKKIQFDESYKKYYQEVDFCYKLWESGQRVVVAPHAIYHYVEGTLQTMGYDRSRIMELGNEDKKHFKKIWIDTGRMQKLYQRIQPQIPFNIE